MGKKRLDILLAERGLAESRSQAQRLVMSGLVRIDGQVQLKASSQVDLDARVDVETSQRFVFPRGRKTSSGP